MTWVKTGTEFSDDIASAGLSDAAYRTHHEALTWLYRIERDDMRVPKHLVRRFAGSDQHEIAVKDLVAAGFWTDDGDAWVVEHHASVLRQSMAAQHKHRERERERQARKRAAAAKVDSNVGPNVGETLTDRQTRDALDVSGDDMPCDLCPTKPSRTNSAGARLCATCAPHLFTNRRTA